MWNAADILRGTYKQHQYGEIILPFTMLARLDAVLAPTKDAVLAASEGYDDDAELVTESDPDLVADLMTKLENSRVFTRSEVEHLWRIWRTTGVRNAHGKLNSVLQPAVDRFRAQWQQAVNSYEGGEVTELEVLKEFRKTLGGYVKTYDFFSQILKKIRDLPPAQQVSFLMDLGLYERLRGQGEVA